MLRVLVIVFFLADLEFGVGEMCWVSDARLLEEVLWSVVALLLISQVFLFGLLRQRGRGIEDVSFLQIF